MQCYSPHGGECFWWYENVSRDSTTYGELYGINEAHTLLRGTLRYKVNGRNFCEYDDTLLFAKFEHFHASFIFHFFLTDW